MVKWTEVSAYSGMPVEEDAPTNATGAAVAGTGDDSSVVVVRKKKKKTFLDARTKEYKAHQKRLEAARQRREERKKAASKINEGQLDEMKKVEITLNNPNDVKKIKKDVIDLTNKKRKVNITMKQVGKKLIIDGGDYDITREVKDIRNFIGFKSARVIESVNEGEDKVAQLKTKLSKEKDTDKLEAQIIDLKGQLALAKQQLENEKNKAVKPEPNPETGEVPLTVGVAYKHLRDKMKKESEKKKTMVGTKPNKVDTKPEVEFNK